MGKTLGKNAERKLRELMQRGLKLNPHGVDGRGSPRFDIHVKVTGPEVDGYYPCITTDYNCYTEAWVEYTATCSCFGANDEVLTTGKRYRAINYGQIGDLLVFVVDANVPELGCYLEYDPITGELTLDTDAVAGQGLVVDDDSDSGTCDAIKVDIGCGLEFSGNKVVVDLDGIAGCGLTTEADDSDSDSCDRLKVDVPALVGDGLIVQEDSTSGGGCDKIAFPLDVEEEVTLGPFILATGFTFEKQGCLIHIKAYKQDLTAGLNQDGVVVSLQQGPGEPSITTLGTIDLRDGCECCDSDSGAWDCVDGTCVESPSGPYPTIEDCEANCSSDSNNCCTDGCDSYTIYADDQTTVLDTVVRTCTFPGYESGCIWVGSVYILYACGGDSLCLRTPIPAEMGGCTPNSGGTDCAWNMGSGTLTGLSDTGGCAQMTPTTCGGWDCGYRYICCGDSDSGCSGFPGAGWYCVLGVCTYIDNCTAWDINGRPTPRYDDNTCGGACGSTGGSCCSPAPGNLTATVTATTGDCGCFAGLSDVLVKGTGDNWANEIPYPEPCSYPIQLGIHCNSGTWSCDGAQGCSLTVHSCSPFSATMVLTFSSYVPPGLNCVGTVTFTITE